MAGGWTPGGADHEESFMCPSPRAHEHRPTMEDMSPKPTPRSTRPDAGPRARGVARRLGAFALVGATALGLAACGNEAEPEAVGTPIVLSSTGATGSPGATSSAVALRQHAIGEPVGQRGAAPVVAVVRDGSANVDVDDQRGDGTSVRVAEVRLTRRGRPRRHHGPPHPPGPGQRRRERRQDAWRHRAPDHARGGQRRARRPPARRRRRRCASIPRRTALSSTMTTTRRSTMTSTTSLPELLERAEPVRGTRAHCGVLATPPACGSCSSRWASSSSPSS